MAPAILSALLGLSFIARFIEHHAVHVTMGDALPAFRFVVWGWIESPRYAAVPFFLVKLPSWSYEPLIYRRDFALCQRALLWKGGHGWRSTFIYP